MLKVEERKVKGFEIEDRVWTNPQKSIEWIEAHSEEIHRKELDSCFEYSPDVDRSKI